MTDSTLTDTLARAAGPDAPGFDHHDVERRVTARRRSRRRARAGLGAAGVVAVLGLGALAVDHRGGDPDDVQTGPAAGADHELVSAITGTWELQGMSIVSGVGGESVLELRADGTVEGTNPCGSFRADTWTVTAGRLEVGDLDVDSHRCHPDPGRAESLLLDILRHRPEASRGVDDGVADQTGAPDPWPTLQLTAPDDSFVVFHREVRAPG
jgi:hypothetical protein